MASIQSTIFLSVLSGIITSSLIFLFVQLFRTVVIPWYQELTYQGVKVCGTWYTKLNNGDQLITIELAQSANQLDGTATFSTNKQVNSHYEPLRVFLLKGSVQDRFLSLSGAHRDRQRLGISSFLLEVIGDGRKLKGILTFYSVTSFTITSEQILLTREVQESKPMPSSVAHSQQVKPKL